MKKVIAISLFLLAGVLASAQDDISNKNIVITNYSFAFFGTGDSGGSSLGIHYHRSIFGRLGVNLGFSKATYSGEGQLDLVRFNNNGEILDEIEGLELTGEGPYPLSIGYYNIYNLGISYKVSDGERQSLLASFGYNYKKIQWNQASTVFGGPDNELFVQGLRSVGSSEGGIYLGLDYLYYINEGVSIGIHLNVDDSSNIVSKAGGSIGYRF